MVICIILFIQVLDIHKVFSLNNFNNEKLNTFKYKAVINDSIIKDIKSKNRQKEVIIMVPLFDRSNYVEMNYLSIKNNLGISGTYMARKAPKTTEENIESQILDSKSQ